MTNEELLKEQIKALEKLIEIQAKTIKALERTPPPYTSTSEILPIDIGLP